MSVKWQKVKLGDVTTLIRGKYITRDSVNEGDIPVILGGREPAYYCDTANHDGPCVVISRSGASAGFVTYWNEPICVTDGFLFEATDLIDIRYLYFCLKSQQQSLNEMQNGAGIPHVTGAALKSREIPFPPLPVQKKIASILSAYDDLIENNRRRIAILEEMARKEFDRMIEHARGAKTVPEVIEINPVVPKPKSVKVRYVPMSSLSTSGMAVDLQDCEMRQSSTSVRFVNGDTLLARITPCLENGKTGFVNFLDEGEIACGSSEFIVLRGKTVSPYFVYCVARMERFRGCAINSMVGASGRQRVQPACFNDFVLSIPTVKELSAFDLAVKPMFDQIGTLLKVNMKLAAARDALLPKLMSGRICSD